jgi:hypothetical protein
MGKRGIKSVINNHINKSPTSIITNVTYKKPQPTKQSDYKLHTKYLTNRNNNETQSVNNKQASKRSDDPEGSLRIYHQNIRGIYGKINEFMIHLSKTTPDIICFTGHHLKEFEIEVTHLPNYKLGAKFCRKQMKNGGACIYIKEDLKFTSINVQNHGKEQDLEIAAIQIKLNKVKLIIITIELQWATLTTLYINWTTYLIIFIKITQNS